MCSNAPDTGGARGERKSVARRLLILEPQGLSRVRQRVRVVCFVHPFFCKPAKEDYHCSRAFFFLRTYCFVLLNRSALHGRDHYAAIAAEVGDKTADEVQKYAAVFWKRLRELEDAERITKLIEQGEGKIERLASIKDNLEKKMRRCALCLLFLCCLIGYF